MNVKEAMSLWAASRPAEPVVPLELQSILAIIFVVLFLLSTGVFLTAGKGSTAPLASALVASISVGFGAVYVINAVHVYTG